MTANPELIGKTAMEIFDLTVQALTDESLMVILNNHVIIHIIDRFLFSPLFNGFFFIKLRIVMQDGVAHTKT